MAVEGKVARRKACLLLLPGELAQASRLQRRWSVFPCDGGRADTEMCRGTSGKGLKREGPRRQAAVEGCGDGCMAGVALRQRLLPFLVHSLPPSFLFHRWNAQCNSPIQAMAKAKTGWSVVQKGCCLFTVAVSAPHTTTESSSYLCSFGRMKSNRVELLFRSRHGIQQSFVLACHFHLGIFQHGTTTAFRLRPWGLPRQRAC